MNDWTIEQARATYSIDYWGGGYFAINERGRVVVRPSRDPESAGVELDGLVHQIQKSGLALPVLVRFPGILHDRVRSLRDAFAAARAADGYQGGFTAVYPIKVNQQRRVVEEIVNACPGEVGLEAGSKPELLAVMALSDQRGGVVICNGYKDREYIRLALIGRQLGLRVFIVVEKLSELELVIRESKALGVRPLLGVRLRLASIGTGNWQNTGGEKAKFGLSAAQLLHVVDRLREEGMADALRLLHCHMGSQIANIRDIQRGMREFARFYVDLREMGLSIDYADVGGGLGIDYEGTRSRSFCSINYSVQEYANNIVHTLWEMCAEHNLPHPHIVTESGRAMSAHHAVLVTNVVDTERAPVREDIPPAAADEPLILADLRATLEGLSGEAPSAPSALEAYHDVTHWLSEAQSMYNHGVLSLQQRAIAEQLYFAICWRVRELLRPQSQRHRTVLDELNEKLSDKYFCNFSLFQSLPDVWAIEQVFPIMPLHRLDERPNRRTVLEDITCDSDGRIEQYVDNEGIESSLPLHSLNPGELYLLGMFLVGAYQEILGDIHNLFGDTDSVHVDVKEDGSYELVQPQRGDTVDSVLRYVDFDAKALVQRYRQKCIEAELGADQRDAYLRELEAGLSGYTYLED